jgi:hypothetical protein
MTPEQIASIVVQLPIVAVMLWIYQQQTAAHQKAIEWHRDQVAKIMDWLMKQDVKGEQSPG